MALTLLASWMSRPPLSVISIVTKQSERMPFPLFPEVAMFFNDPSALIWFEKSKLLEKKISPNSFYYL
jgi:hypothetical protein